MSGLPVSQAYRLADRAEEQRWLVTGLWSEQAVGIVGGEPKCCKSFLALDLAVAVASGTACLRRFPVARPGRVLLYAAEDALHVVRRRLEGICAAAGCELKDLDVHVITTATLRIDQAADRERLEHTIAQLKPRLLILDPFVRLHRIDENTSGEVAPLLAYLRTLQRQHQLAVLVVHHARKTAGRKQDGRQNDPVPIRSQPAERTQLRPAAVACDAFAQHLMATRQLVHMEGRGVERQ